MEHRNGPIAYDASFIENPDNLFEILWNEIEWIKHDDAPRREYWSNDFDRPYTYGRGAGVRTYEAQPFHPEVERVRRLLAEQTGVYYEACFVNGYENERQALGWHADDSTEIDHTKPIAVISLGERRPIEFRSNETGDKTRLDLDNGSLFVMLAGMQQTHQHRIPKAGFAARPRISLTFRSLLGI